MCVYIVKNFFLPTRNNLIPCFKFNYKASVIDDYSENYELQELRNKRHAITIKEIIKW